MKQQKCKKCGNAIKVKDAKFCPFCGEVIEPEEEFAGYTRGQYFSFTGDSEFKDVWEKVRNMSAEDALAWIREYPHTHYVYRFFGKWSDRNGDRVRHFARCIYDCEVKEVSTIGEVTPKKYKLTTALLGEIGKQAFFTEEECKEAIDRVK